MQATAHCDARARDYPLILCHYILVLYLTAKNFRKEPLAYVSVRFDSVTKSFGGSSSPF
jgi:hypothetical protein